MYVTLIQAFSHSVEVLLEVTYDPILNFKSSRFAYEDVAMVCWYFTTAVFVLFSVNCGVYAHLCVIFHHFRCPMSLFQGHVACWNLSQQGLSVCMSLSYSCLSRWF